MGGWRHLLLQKNRTEGSEENTGCTWETRLSLNSDTLKAPPTLMTFFSPKQLKFGSGGGNGLKGRDSGDRQLTEGWCVCLCLVSAARGTHHTSEVRVPVSPLTDFSSVIFFFPLMSLLIYLSLGNLGQQLLCCCRLFCSGLIFHFSFLKIKLRNTLWTLSPPQKPIPPVSMCTILRGVLKHSSQSVSVGSESFIFF